MEPLFNQYRAYNRHAIDVASELAKLISDWFDKQLEAGFDPRELTLLAYDISGNVCAEKVLRIAMKMRKEENNASTL